MVVALIPFVRMDRLYAASSVSTVSSWTAYSSGSFTVQLSNGTYTDTYTLNASWVSKPSSESTYHSSSQQVRFTLTSPSTKRSGCNLTLQNNASSVTVATKTTAGGETQSSGNSTFLTIPVQITVPTGYEYVKDTAVIDAYAGPSNHWRLFTVSTSNTSTSSMSTVSWEGKTTTAYILIDAANVGLVTEKRSGTYYKYSGTNAYLPFTAKSYTLSASAVTRNEAGTSSSISTTGGTVSPASQTVTYNSTGYITATAKSGYTFKGWATSTTATSYASTSASYRPTVTGNVTYYAIFQKDTPTYTVTAAAATRNQAGTSTSISTTGGYVSPTSQSVTSGSYASMTAYAYSGYTFKGWATSYTATSYLSTSSTYSPRITANATYYAIFQKVPTYTVTGQAVWRYEPGNSPSGSGTNYEETTAGSVSYTSQEVDSGDTAYLRATANTGYEFVGWATSKTATSFSSTSTTYYPTIYSNTTYYGIFRGIQYTATFNLNGGNINGSTSSLTRKYYYNSDDNSLNGGTDLSSSVKVTDIPQKDGYAFTGYYTSSSGGTKVINADGTIVRDGTYFDTSSKYSGYSAWVYAGSRTFYAQYVVANYTVTASAVTRSADGSTSTVSTTGGTVSPTSQEVSPGGTASLSATANSGYTFKGWATSSNATSYSSTSTSYSPTISSAQTYYAIFQENDTSSPVPSISAGSPGTSLSLTLSGTDNVGIVEYYWGTSSNPSSYTSVTSSKNWSTTKSITTPGKYYLAVRDAAGNRGITDITIYKTTFEVTNGQMRVAQSLLSTPQSFYSAEDDALTTPVVYPDTGYVSPGKWTYTDSGTTYTVNENSSYTPNASRTLTAECTVPEYTVTYNANGGTGAPSSQTQSGGTTLIISQTRPTRINYVFLGWAEDVDDADDGIVDYEPGDEYTAGVSTTLYAAWAPAYTVNYHPNGGTPDTVYSSSHAYGVNGRLRDNTYVRKQYYFTGWATSEARANAGTVDFTDEQEVTQVTSASATPGAVVDLYAVWSVAVHVYDLEGGGSTPATAPVTITNPLEITTSVTFTKKAITGEPLEGVKFYLNGISTSGKAYVNALGTSDENGAVTFTGLLPGEYTLSEDEDSVINNPNFTGIVPAGGPWTLVVTGSSDDPNYCTHADAQTMTMNYCIGSGVMDCDPVECDEEQEIRVCPSCGYVYVVSATGCGNCDDDTDWDDEKGYWRPATDFNGLTSKAEYTAIRETAEPAWYIRTGTPDGTGTKLANNTVINPLEVLTEFMFVKYGDSDSEPLQGVQFRLQGESNYRTPVNMTATSTRRGTVAFLDVPYGVYSLTEISGNNDEPGTITVDGVVRDKNELGWEVTVGSTITIIDKRTEQPVTKVYNPLTGITVSFDKKDSEGEPLGGADFLLVGAKAAGGQYQETATSSASGKVEFSEVPEGVYTLTETSVANATRSVIKSNDEWEVRVVKDPDTHMLSYTIKKNGEGDNLTTITNELEPYKSVEFYKLNESSSKLGGAVFRLSGASDMGTEVDKAVTSEENGLVSFENVYYGTYVLTETTAPYGYKASDETYSVEVKESGVVIRNSNGRRIEVYKGDDVIRNALYTTNIKVIKEDATSERLLDGAVYVLEGKSEKGIDIEREVTSGEEEEGLMTFYDIPIGTYTLTEKTAPKGYRVDDKEYTVNVTQGGTSIVVNETPLQEDGEGVYHVGDEKKNPLVGHFVIKKVDKDNDPLGNAEFTLSGVSQDDEEILFRQRSNEETGLVEFKDIPQGIYDFTESRAANDAYDVTFEMHEVEVSGTKVIMRNARGVEVQSWEQNDDTPYVVMNPYVLKGGQGFTIKKVDTVTGSPMEDVFFTLTGTEDSGLTVDFTDRTDENGMVTFDNLNHGTYTLTENAFPNYYMIAPISIRVSNDGVILTQGGERLEPIDTQSYDIYKFENQPYQNLKIRKVDTEQNKLQGATFRLVETNYQNTLYDVMYDGTNFSIYDAGTENLTSDEVYLTLREDDGTAKATGGMIPASAFQEKPVKGDSMTLESNGNSAVFTVKLNTKIEVKIDKDDIFSQQYTTNYSGLIEFKNIPEGEYLLMETDAPEGFFRVPTIFNVHVTRTDVTIDGLEKYGDAYEVEDPMLKTAINIRKVNTVGNTLAGATYRLYGTTIQKKPFSAVSTVSGNNGIATIEDIPAGSYTLMEITAPDNYMVGSEEYMIDVDYNEELQEFVYKCVSNEKGEVASTFESGVITYSYTNYQYPDLKVRKVDQDGRPLEGAEFTVMDESGSEEYETQATNSKGYVTFKGLKDYGTTLYIKETKKPVGYMGESESFKVVIETGNEQPYTVTKGGTPITVSAMDGAYGFSVTNTQLLYDFAIRKVDSETDDPVNGAGFTLITLPDEDGNYEEFDSTPSSGITGNDGNISWSDLPVGTYVLKETQKPDGYVADVTTWRVVVSEPASGESPVTVYEDDTALPTTKSGGTFYTEIENTPGHTVRVRKLRADTEQPIIGADLTIYKSTGGYVESVESEAEPTEVLLAAGSYTMNENTTPTGCITAEPIEFTVGDDGNVTSTTAGAASGNMLTMYDEVYKGKVELNKTDGTSPLAGAQFVLMGSSALGNSVSKAAVSQGNGKVVFNNIEVGRYTLLETASPNDTMYEKDEATYYAEVYVEDGVVKSRVENGRGQEVTEIANRLIQTFSNVTINKNVTGSLGDLTKDFAFTFSSTTSYPNTAYSVEKNGVDAGTVVSNASGVITYNFTLKDNDTVTIKNLPDTFGYTVTESANNHRASYTTDTNKSGGNTVSNTAMSTETLTIGTDKVVSVTNERNIATNTGSVANSINGLLLALAVILQAILFVKLSRLFTKKK